MTLLLLELERLNELGPKRACLAQIDGKYALLPIARGFVPRGTRLWHVTRDLTNFLLIAERPIRSGPDRRCSTQAGDGNVVVSTYGRAI